MINPNKPPHPGNILRAHREERSLTLRDLSKKTGLPVSTLSKLENGKMAMTYDKMVRLGAGLEVDLASLISAKPSQVAASEPRTGRRVIVRNGEIEGVHTKAMHHFYPAIELIEKMMIPVIIDVTAKHPEELGGLLSHRGEEYLYVLEGSMMLHTDLYSAVQLNKGDSIYFDSAMAHAYVRVGDDPCRVLSICAGSDAAMISHDAQASTAR